jgi:ABC-type polysaccharide/polyol phosphate transport system ATPase subunit
MRPAASQTPAVAVHGVSKSFHLPHERTHTLKERALHPFRRSGGERFEALRDVSFSVAPGEFFGIVGRNGSGKSTLLKCLAGIYRVDGGEIYVNGRMSTFIELGVGFNPDLAALDNVILNSVMLGVPPRQARERFDEIIAFAELEEFVDLKIKNYSSGMLVRLAFATAIQADADILLIDEVLAVGDAAFQQKCFDVFIRMKEEGRTILFVTHDMATVTRFCDRALLLERGEVVTLDEPDLTAQRYLRLNFGQDTQPQEEEERGVHWRDGSTEIVEAWTEDELGSLRAEFLATERCTFKARVRFDREMADPNFNVVWVSERGQNVFAVSTAADPEGTGSYGPGDEVVFIVSFVPSLAPGRYTLTMNVSRRGSGQELVERWDALFSMVVNSSRAAGGLVDLPHELVIERQGALRLEAEPTS